MSYIMTRRNIKLDSNEKSRSRMYEDVEYASAHWASHEFYETSIENFKLVTQELGVYFIEM